MSFVSNHKIFDLTHSQHVVAYHVTFSYFFAYVTTSHHANLSKMSKHWGSFLTHCMVSHHGTAVSFLGKLHCPAHLFLPFLHAGNGKQVGRWRQKIKQGGA